MSRKTLTMDTLRGLFARSGNQCAFPGCKSPLVSDNNLFIGHICHIEAASPNGPRFNRDQSPEERFGYDNLTLLCYPHHVTVDHDPLKFSVTKLREMKRKHESSVGKNFEVDENFLAEVVKDIERYWTKVRRATTVDHVVPGLAFELNVHAEYPQLSSEASTLLNSLSEMAIYTSTLDDNLDQEIRSHLQKLGYELSMYQSVPYYENPFFNRGWEIHHVGIPNRLTELNILIRQMELKYLEAIVAANPQNHSTRSSLNQKRQEFLRLSRRWGYLD